MNLSLQTRLALAIVTVAGVVAGALAALLYAAVATVLWEGFDREVREGAALVGRLVEWDEADGYELEGGDALARSLAAGAHPLRLIVRSPAGPLLHDPALADLSQETDGAITATTEGHELRGALVRIAPRTDDGVAAPPGSVEVIAVRDTAGVRAELATIAGRCWLLVAATVLLAAAVARAVARRGMAPVAEVARALDRIGGPDDALAVAEDAVPRELRPILRGTSGLLDRLRAAFARERRFTADVSHELRTPLAVMRSAIDVALQGEREPADYRRRLVDVQRELGRVAEMLDRLLTLTRASAGQIPLRRTPLSIYALVEECWAPLRAAARRRGLTFRNDLDVDRSVDADEATLRMIVANLLANAAEYTEEGGAIAVEGGGEAVLLRVRDSGPPIPPEHLERLFELFWRADPARSEAGVHGGIGLSLARALARCQGLDVELVNDGRAVVASIVVVGG